MQLGVRMYVCMCVCVGVVCICVCWHAWMHGMAAGGSASTSRQGEAPLASPGLFLSGASQSNISTINESFRVTPLNTKCSSHTGLYGP